MAPDDDPSDDPPGLVLYTTADGSIRLQLRVEEQTLWLTQSQMASIFQTTKQNISLHIQNVFQERELRPESTVKPYLTVQTEGSRRVERLLDHYSLDVVIAVGYRVRSARGTQFRQWATATLREYLTKGFVIDDAARSDPPHSPVNGTVRPSKASSTPGGSVAETSRWEMSWEKWMRSVRFAPTRFATASDSSSEKWVGWREWRRQSRTRMSSPCKSS